MSKAQIIAVSVALPQLAEVVDNFLAAQAGERVSFVLVTQIGEVAQYVSNTAHPYCLHLWRPFGGLFATPPTFMVGPMAGEKAA